MSDPVTTIQTASNTLDALSSFLDAAEGFIPKLVMACAFLSAVCPPPDPKSRFYPVLSFLSKLINSFAINVGHAKNKGRE